MSVPTVRFRGAELNIEGVTGQPLPILVDFGTLDVTGFTWLGQVRKSATSAVLAEFTYSNPTANTVLFEIADTSTIPPGLSHVWGIDMLTPQVREVFFGVIKLDQDNVRP